MMSILPTELDTRDLGQCCPCDVGIDMSHDSEASNHPCAELRVTKLFQEGFSSLTVRCWQWLMIGVSVYLPRKQHRAGRRRYSTGKALWQRPWISGSGIAIWGFDPHYTWLV